MSKRAWRQARNRALFKGELEADLKAGLEWGVIEEVGPNEAGEMLYQVLPTATAIANMCATAERMGLAPSEVEQMRRDLTARFR